MVHIIAILILAWASAARDDKCPTPQKVLLTAEPWTARDQRAYDGARVRCGFLYPRSPCMKTFTRIEPNRYQVVCSAEESK